MCLPQVDYEPDHSSDRSGKDVLLLACGALAREILDLKSANGWEHLHLECLPAQLHLYPDRIPEAIDKAIRKYRQEFASIFVVYADCGTGGQLAAVCRKHGVEMMPGAHCYGFFSGVEHFNSVAEQEIDAFYLTDFLVRHFESFVTKPLGLDRHPELRDVYFGNYRKLIYLAQTEDPELDAKAVTCAENLKLEYIRRSTGYGDLATTLSQLKKPQVSAP